MSWQRRAWHLQCARDPTFAGISARGHRRHDKEEWQLAHLGGRTSAGERTTARTPACATGVRRRHQFFGGLWRQPADRSQSTHPKLTRRANSREGAKSNLQPTSATGAPSRALLCHAMPLERDGVLLSCSSVLLPSDRQDEHCVQRPVRKASETKVTASGGTPAPVEGPNSALSGTPAAGLATLLHQNISVLSDCQRGVAATLAKELESAVDCDSHSGPSQLFSQEGVVLKLLKVQCFLCEGSHYQGTLLALKFSAEAGFHGQGDQGLLADAGVQSLLQQSEAAAQELASMDAVLSVLFDALADPASEKQPMGRRSPSMSRAASSMGSQRGPLKAVTNVPDSRSSLADQVCRITGSAGNVHWSGCKWRNVPVGWSARHSLPLMICMFLCRRRRKGKPSDAQQRCKITRSISKTWRRT